MLRVAVLLFRHYAVFFGHYAVLLSPLDTMQSLSVFGICTSLRVIRLDTM
jgi:hypothetical protein